MKFEVLMGTVSQSIDNNTSVIRVWCNLYTDGYASMYGVTAPLTIQVNGGGAIENVAVNINTNSKVTLWQKEYTIGHDPNGKKTTNIYLKLDLNTGGYGSAAYGWNPDLPIIPRASTLSDITGTLGSAMTINISRKDSNFTHNLKYEFGKFSGSIATGVGASVSWTPPLNLATAMPNKTSDWGNITVDTYNGSTKIGSATCRLTLNIPESMKPTFSGVTLSDTNTVVSNIVTTANTFVEILSNVKVAFNGATGVQGSTITGYKAEMVGENQTITSDGGVFGLVKKSGEITIRSSVQDSRGRWSDTKDTKVNFLEYFGPKAFFTAERSGSARTTLTVIRTAQIAPLTVGNKQLNKMTITFKTRPMDGTEWTTNNGSASGVWTTQSELTASAANLAGTFSGTQSWEVMMIVEDLFDKATYSYPVSTDKVLTSKTKDGIGIGKIREHGALDVAGEIYANNKPIQHHQLTSNDGRSPFNSSGTVDLNTKTVNSFFSCNSPVNGPIVGTGPNEFYASVYSESDTYLAQQLIQKGSGRMFTRTRQAGTWTTWIEYAPLNSIAEFTAVNQTKVYTSDITMPLGLVATASRIGNLVTLTLKRAVKSIGAVEYAVMSETVPSGYRPTAMAHFNITANSGSTVSGTGIIHIASDGGIRLTNGITGDKVWTGTITYLTTDPFPAE